MASTKDFEKKHNTHKKHAHDGKHHANKHQPGKHAHAKHTKTADDHKTLENDAETVETAMDQEANGSSSSSKSKRRPGRDSTTQSASPDVAVIDVQDGEIDTRAGADEASASSAEEHGSHGNSSRVEDDSWAQPKDKIELNFYGSEILRAKFPKAFDVAETVATDWMKDGNFEGLPLGHPLAQYFAAKGLKKAKEVEKKVLESPVTEKVAMQALQAGMKAQEFITQIREKVQKK